MSEEGRNLKRVRKNTKVEGREREREGEGARYGNKNENCYYSTLL